MRNRLVWAICSFLLLTSGLAADLSYTVSFDGIPSGKMMRELQEISELVQMRQKPPSSLTALRRRADRDVAPMKAMLQGLGYYDSLVIMDVEERSTVHHVRVNIQLGQIYTLSSYELVSVARHPEAEQLLQDALLLPDSSLKLDEIKLSDLKIKKNKPAVAKPLLKSREKVLQRLAERSYPLAQIVDEDYVVDRSAKTLAVTLFINSGPAVTFGPTRIDGLESVDLDFIRAKIAWKQGEPYHPELIEETQHNLERSRLFASALITPADLPNNEDELPMLLDLKESKHRSIGVGLSFTTDLGPGIATEWEHRNMRGLGEKLNLLGEVEDKRQRGRGVYRKHDWRKVNQDLIFSLDYLQQRTENFSEKTVEGQIVVERKLNPHLRFSYGGSLKYIATDKSDNNTNRTFLAAPLKVRWTTADDPLDPTRGILLTAQTTPSTAIPAADLTYLKSRGSFSAYKAVTQDRQMVAAAKVTAGSIIGARRESIPPPDRFYAGSESLLRGYDRLSVSPLDGNRKPVGGRSLFVLNTELRVRSTEKLGWVGFFEMGNVWEGAAPQIHKKMLKSVGVGLRYHTPIGPVRLDLAVPLDKRSGVDEDWEFYLNIGQAF